MGEKLKIKDIDIEELRQLVEDRNPYDVVFDIETGSLDRDTVDGFFQPEKVATGNLSDLEKIAGKIQEAKDEFYKRATLHAHLSQVVAVGYGVWDRKGTLHVCCDIEDEHTLVSAFWSFYFYVSRNNSTLIGHNIVGFDLPFLTRRAWVLGFDVPNFVTKYNKPQDFIKDTKKEWKLGTWGFDQEISLDNLCKALGVPTKVEGMTGADFHKVLPVDKDKAIEYLRADIVASFYAARGIGVVKGK